MGGIISFLVYVMIMAAIYGILALTLNFQYGITGLINFGHVAPFCLGAYISTLIVLAGHAPIIIGFVGAFIIGAISGLLISLPTGNLKADYWAISTLAFAEIIRLFFLNGTWMYGGPTEAGPFGIRAIPRPFYSFFTRATYPFFYLGLCLVALGLVFLLLQYLEKSPFGRVLKLIREDEELALALGKNTFQFKAISMTVSSGFAGLAGGLFAHYMTYIEPNQFLPIETFIVWAMVIVGGKGNLFGSIVGAAIIPIFYNSTRFLKDYIPLDISTLAALRMVVIGLLIVSVMMFLRKGILPERKSVYQRPKRFTGDGNVDG